MASEATSTLRHELSEKFVDWLSPDDEVLSECVNICQNFNMTAEDLFFKWEAYHFSSATTASRTTFTRNVFNAESALALKQYIQSQVKKKKQEEQEQKKRAKLNAGLMTRGKGAGLIRNGAASMHGGFGGGGGGPGTPIKLGSGSAEEKYALAGSSKVFFVGPKDDPESRKKRAYRYMYEKVSERGAVLDRQIEKAAELVMKHYGVQEFGDPSASTESETTVVGRIALDAESSSASAVKLNESCIVLESSRWMGSGIRVPLRFDPQVKVRGGPKGSGGLGLFPGAIVALKGKNGGGGWFNVTEILALPPLKVRPHETSEVRDDAFSMCIASGPYTPDADMNYKPWSTLVSTLKATKPAVVLLLGPFIDSSHSHVKNGEINKLPTDVFRDRFTESLLQFLDVSPGSLVLILPSIKDIISDHAVFPQCELSQEFSGDIRIHLLPNPCRFSVNGVSFGVSSIDVLFHLRKEEFFKRVPEEVEPVVSVDDSVNNDSMVNTCRHLLQQRSFYPIFPSPLELSHEVNLDISHSEGLFLGGEEDEPDAPDVLVIPSRLKHFAKTVDNTVAINPSFLTKGIYATLSFAGHTEGTVRERIKVDLERLSS
ncbi:hypothetical protein JAAARDRAFT_189548 [Jaapia argillacea MUCL 33604]|uniref:DNA polymerase alpha subunit B n=1 Tax=Jaapia argillacea MUCL 33604 TaxID=933084 RepID=A0A067Q7M7_9AGAM|nr:hypothetical protein JAAARDRAFT_189548 [Jaapia argillacea MUCL 33604]